MDFDGFGFDDSRGPVSRLRGSRWFHELPGDPRTVDGSAVAWPDEPERCPVIIPAQRRSPEDW